MAPGGVFFATFNERPSSFPLDRIDQKAGRKPFLTERNLFWYYRSDLAWAATIAPWTFQYIGDWGHPMGQRMVAFTRRDAAMPTAAKGRANAAAVQSSSPWAHHPMPRGTGRMADAQRFLYRARRWTARHIAP
jgi:hypothetical protein